jgi:hypothetical protein
VPRDRSYGRLLAQGLLRALCPVLPSASYFACSSRHTFS